MVAQGYLIVQKHPTEDLRIYNYSQKTQYEGYWNEITLACRGLILDSKGQIHASTFDKFFNYGQKEAVIPENCDFIAYEKMDGSYIGSYWVNGEVYLNTKGSFDFDYVKMATHILNTRYAEAKKKMVPELTYVFELIFPAGRIVLDYGDRQDLVLLAVFSIESGKELPVEMFAQHGFNLAPGERYPAGTDLKVLQERNINNKEGYVVKFLAPPHGIPFFIDYSMSQHVRKYPRVKIKFDEYVYLHRIITNVTSYDIYDAIRREGGVPEELLERVPDEFYAWVRMYEKKLFTKYAEVAEMAFHSYDAVIRNLPPDFSRHQFIRQASGREFTKFNTSLMINIYDLDFRTFRKHLWANIKPPFEKPFQFAGKQLEKVMAEVSEAVDTI